MLIIFFSVVTYTCFIGFGCWHGSDLDTLPTFTDLDLENSKKWCADNSNCEGFTLYRNLAYFKGQGCNNDLFHSERRTTYIKDEILMPN